MRRVLAFYKFIPVAHPQSLVEELQQLGEQLSVVVPFYWPKKGLTGRSLPKQIVLTRWSGHLSKPSVP